MIGRNGVKDSSHSVEVETISNDSNSYEMVKHGLLHNNTISHLPSISLYRQIHAPKSPFLSYYFHHEIKKKPTDLPIIFFCFYDDVFIGKSRKYLL